jgi:NADH-quinone oxidoreductase subunit G
VNDARTVTLTIDGTTLTVPEGTLLVEAAKTIETDVPVYCYHPKLGPAGLCRICLVEIEKAPKLQIACNTAVTDGMVVHTYGKKVEDGRRAVMEFLLLNHPLDCPICDKGGECDLQDYSMAYGQGASRLADPKAKKPKAIDLGPTIVLDDERCIVCQRCSRFDEIVTNERSLVVKDRGQRDVIATASGEPYRSNFSGNVTELCPVGALTSKTYRFKSRPWDNHRTHTTCTQCAVGCQLNVDERYGTIARTMSDPHDDAVSDGWLCDRGRYNVAFPSDARRLASPMLRDGDDFVQIGWDDAIALWATHLREAIASGGASAAGVLGGARLLNEEIVLLERVMRGLGIEHLDWRAGRQRQASPGLLGGSYLDLENAQAIVAFGRPPSQAAPVMDLRIRKAVTRHGARYVTVGPHAAGSFVAATRVANADDAAPLLAGAERIALVWDGIDVSAGRAAASLATALVARGANVITYVASETNNARGAEAFGLLPRAGALDGAALLRAAADGNVRTLSLFGANPVLHHPLGARFVTDALARVPFVVATELFLTESARLANLVLPARASLEKSGHTYDLTGMPHAVNGGHAAPEGTLADGEMLVALAAELGLALPAPDELQALASAAAPRTATSFADAAIVGSGDSPGIAATPTAPGSLRLALASHIFAGGGTVFFDDRLASLRPLPSATFAPEDAAAAGLAPGDLVDLAGPGEATLADLVVAIEPGASPGFVTVIDGLPGAPANAFAGGEAVALANVRAARGALTAGAV